jgi:holliday junction DNA helicase RuvA
MAGKIKFCYSTDMIAQIEGSLSHIGETFAIVAVHGIGYRVNMAKDTLLGLSEGDNIFLWTYLAVREDALDLYGFLSQNDHKMFEKLLTLPGVGPKTAMGFLSSASVETLCKAVSSQDAGYLAKMSGIGKKSAEKIIAGLKDKLDKFDSTEKDLQIHDEADAIEAIKSLGYSLQESRDALRALPQDICGVGNRVKAALKYLGK